MYLLYHETVLGEKAFGSTGGSLVLFVVLLAKCGSEPFC
jgi:hypothetical protein